VGGGFHRLFVSGSLAPKHFIINTFYWSRSQVWLGVRDDEVVKKIAAWGEVNAAEFHKLAYRGGDAGPIDAWDANEAISVGRSSMSLLDPQPTGRRWPFPALIGETMFTGILMSLGCQIAGICVTIFIFKVAHGEDDLGWIFYGPALWGLAQWAFVLPLRVRLKRRGRLRSVRGLIWTSIAGTIASVTGLPLYFLMGFK